MTTKTHKKLTWIFLFSVINWVFCPSLFSGGQIGTNFSSTHSFLAEDNPYKYSSYYQDKESAMYYLKARYYSSELMRFISRDTYDLSNRYAYCDGNPIEKVDPDGHLPVTPFILWEAVNLVCTVAAAWELGDSINKGDLKMAITSGLVLAVALGSYYACAKGYKMGAQMEMTRKAEIDAREINNFKEIQNINNNSSITEEYEKATHVTSKDQIRNIVKNNSEKLKEFIRDNDNGGVNTLISPTKKVHIKNEQRKVLCIVEICYNKECSTTIQWVTAKNEDGKIVSQNLPFFDLNGLVDAIEGILLK